MLVFDPVQRFIAWWRQERDGSVLPTFAIALVPIITAVGAATDYSQANSVRSGLQTALDSAVLAAARDGSADWQSAALTFFNTNAQIQQASVQTPSFSKTADGKVTGSASAIVPTTFLGVMGIRSMSVTVQSSAALDDSQQAQFCVLALSKTAQPGLRLTGNATIDIKAPNCILQVNSGASGAVSMNGNASIASAENCFVGSMVKVGNATVTPPPHACEQRNDPFAKKTDLPAVGPCDFTNYSVSGSKNVTLSPGTYCGGLQFSGQVNVIFNPGIYIIKDGPLQASAGASFVGDGVAFFLTGAGAAVNLSGQAGLRLTAPKDKDSPLAGFVFFLDQNGASGIPATSSQLSGSSDLYVEGIVYLPKQLVTITGSAEMTAPSPYTSFIADVIELNGNGTLVINNNPANTAVPIPQELQVKLAGQARLLQ